jgi:hypothetical protein
MSENNKEGTMLNSLTTVLAQEVTLDVVRGSVHRFAAELQKLIDAHYAKDFQMLTVPQVRVIFGRTYVKVTKVTVEKNQITHNTVHSFIALKDVSNKEITCKAGDVLKAASWDAPAPHARGSVLNQNILGGVNEYGADYLR